MRGGITISAGTIEKEYSINGLSQHSDLAHQLVLKEQPGIGRVKFTPGRAVDGN
jgi:hypothetical protein